jgi:hypothetical protein
MHNDKSDFDLLTAIPFEFVCFFVCFSDMTKMENEFALVMIFE